MSIVDFKIINHEYPTSFSDNITIFGTFVVQETNTHVVIGFLEYSIFVEKGEGYITRLRIAYSFQGNNFATVLLQAFLAYAKQKPLSVIMASLEPDPLDAYSDLANKYGYESWEDIVCDEESEENTHFMKEHDLLMQERFIRLKNIFFKAGFVECEDMSTKEMKTQLTVLFYL